MKRQEYLDKLATKRNQIKAYILTNYKDKIFTYRDIYNDLSEKLSIKAIVVFRRVCILMEIKGVIQVINKGSHGTRFYKVVKG